MSRLKPAQYNKPTKADKRSYEAPGKRKAKGPKPPKPRRQPKPVPTFLCIRKEDETKRGPGLWGFYFTYEVGDTMLRAIPYGCSPENWVNVNNLSKLDRMYYGIT